MIDPSRSGVTLRFQAPLYLFLEVRRAKTNDAHRVPERLAAAQAAQERRQSRSRCSREEISRDQTLVVGDARLRGAEPSESLLEL